jgi:hypothetical protein
LRHETFKTTDDILKDRARGNFRVRRLLIVHANAISTRDFFITKQSDITSTEAGITTTNRTMGNKNESTNLARRSNSQLRKILVIFAGRAPASYSKLSPQRLSAKWKNGATNQRKSD